MAKLPPPTTFRKDDFGSTGLGSQDALDKLFLPLNAFIKAVRDGLNGTLSVADNLAEEFKTLTLAVPSSGSAFPLTVKPDKVQSVVGLSLVGCLDTSTSPSVPSLGVPSWLLNPDKSVQVTNIPGLTAGHSYRLTFRIMGG